MSEKPSEEKIDLDSLEVSHVRWDPFTDAEILLIAAGLYTREDSLARNLLLLEAGYAMGKRYRASAGRLTDG